VFCSIDFFPHITVDCEASVNEFLLPAGKTSIDLFPMAIRFRPEFGQLLYSVEKTKCPQCSPSGSCFVEKLVARSLSV
jgi:hypothetical protein